MEFEDAVRKALEVDPKSIPPKLTRQAPKRKRAKKPPKS